MQNCNWNVKCFASCHTSAKGTFVIFEIQSLSAPQRKEALVHQVFTLCLKIVKNGLILATFFNLVI